MKLVSAICACLCVNFYFKHRTSVTRVCRNTQVWGKVWLWYLFDNTPQVRNRIHFVVHLSFALLNHKCSRQITQRSLKYHWLYLYVRLLCCLIRHGKYFNAASSISWGSMVWSIEIFPVSSTYFRVLEVAKTYCCRSRIMASYFWSKHIEILEAL